MSAPEPDPFDHAGVDLGYGAGERVGRQIVPDVIDRLEFVRDEHVQYAEGATDSHIENRVMTTTGTAYYATIAVGEQIAFRIEGSGFFGAEMAFLVRYHVPGQPWHSLQVLYEVEGILRNTSYESRHFTYLYVDPQIGEVGVGTEHTGSSYVHTDVDLPRGVPLELVVFPFPLADWGSEAGHHTYTLSYGVAERSRVVCTETEPSEQNSGLPFSIEADANFETEIISGHVRRGSELMGFNQNNCRLDDGRFRCDDDVQGLHFVAVPYVRTESGVVRAPRLRDSDGIVFRFFSGTEEFTTAPTPWAFACPD